MSEPGLADTAAAIRAGDITAEAAARAALERLESRGAALNAVAALTPDSALEAARQVDRDRAAGRVAGPLAGVPMAHKDLFFRTGRRCDCGSRVLAGHVPGTTAAVLDRLDQAGAVDLGTLHMAEIAMSPTGFNAHFGHARNPWNPEHVPGGSSSGSGAAVAAGCIPGSLGTDTGGSVRHPAAACGLTGLKPTHGAVSLAGAMALSASLDTVGPLCRDARDAALLFDAVAGPDPADPTTSGAPEPACLAALDGRAAGAAIARPRGYYDAELEPEIAAALDDAAAVLAGLGAELRETRLDDMDPVNACAHLTLACEASALHRAALRDRPGIFSEQVRARIAPGLAYPAAQYVETLMRRGPITRDWLAQALGDADLALLPVFPVPVPSIAETTQGEAEHVAAVIARLTRNTRAINFLGLPAVALPCGMSRSGLPIAMQLVGRPWAEPQLLRIADAFQGATDWHLRRPPETHA